MTNTLASSRKAWRAIQALTGRAVYGSKYNQVGGDDHIKLPTIDTGDHPFKVSRSGNTIRFTPGLVQIKSGSTSLQYQWEITDENRFLDPPTFGYTYTPGQSRYLFLEILTTLPDEPTLITVVNGSYNIMPASSQTFAVNYSSLPGEPAYHSAVAIAPEHKTVQFLPPGISTPSAAPTKIPICFITDDRIVQLLDSNIAIQQLAAHRNLYTWR